MSDWEHREGETPIDDTSELLVPGVRTRPELSRHEARNILTATIKYLAVVPSAQDAPFTFSWLLELHKEMFGDVWGWAGRPRKSDKTLGIPWHEVEIQLNELTKNLPCWSDCSLLEQAARLHHRAVQIHPFENGNGRWSRMLANIWLKRQGSEPTYWPEEAIGDTSVIRNEYLNGVRAADGFDYSLLIELHRRYTHSIE